MEALRLKDVLLQPKRRCPRGRQIFRVQDCVVESLEGRVKGVVRGVNCILVTLKNDI